MRVIKKCDNGSFMCCFDFFGLVGFFFIGVVLVVIVG